MTTSLRDQLQNSLADNYVLDREIGRGGMATVFLARDEKHHRKVALKVLDPELGAVLGAERFLSEIRVTAGLQHPNLLPLFDSGEAGGLLYYVMPYIDGESLRHRLDREKQLPIDEAVRIAVAIANALDYAHAHGVIHRDLKPENILIQAGQPVVADFGIALAVSNAGGARITQTGLSLGTPQYMSPEQATGDRVIDGRTDVYSLAAMTYEMLAGEPPHSGTSAQAIIAKLMTTAPQPLRSLRASVPPHVAMAVEHGLAKLPADRFASPKAFAEALTNPGFTTGAAPAETAAPKSARITWMLGGLSAALLVAALWGWLRPPEPKVVLRYVMALDSNEALLPTGRYGRIALSPDGSTLVYVGGPRNALMLRRRDALQASPMPGTEQAGAPFFSPDGRRVGFIQNAQTLRIASLDGSPPTTVATAGVGLAGLSWSPDDMIYADGPGSTALVRLAAHAGAKVEHFATLDTTLGERDQVYPNVLPGGKGILYASSRPAGAERGSFVAIMDPKTGARHIVVEGATRAVYTATAGGRLVYTTTDGNLMTAPFDVSSGKVTGEPVVIAQGLSLESVGIDFTVSRSGTLVYIAGASGGSDRELVWVSRDGKAQVVDSTWHAAFIDPAISPDGKQIAVSTGGVGSDATGDIVIRKLESGALAKLSVEGGFNRTPIWSRDGKTLRYAFAEGDTWALVEKPADGSAAAVKRFKSRDALASMTATPDDRTLVYTLGYGAASRLYVRTTGDTTGVPLFPGSEAQSRAPALSPDGKWLAYLSVNLGSRVHVSPFPNAASARWLVSAKRSADPVWSHRGTELFYKDMDSGDLIAVPVSMSPTFSFGAPKVLFSAADYQPRFALSPDDSRFLMVRRVGGVARDRLMMMENWGEGLSRPAKR